MSKKKAIASVPKEEATFADLIEETDKKLCELILQKTVELAQEKGCEEYNQKAIAKLKAMDWHLQQIVEIAAEYST